MEFVNPKTRILNGKGKTKLQFTVQTDLYYLNT